MDSVSASKSDSDPEWNVEEEEKEEDEDEEDDERRGYNNTRPTRVLASASSTVAVAAARAKTTISRQTTKKKHIKSNARPGGMKRKIKKCNQLFRHKLVLPGSYLALSNPFHAAAASIAEADGSAREEDGNTGLHGGDREQWRARRWGGMTEKKFGYKEQQIEENGNAARKIVDNSTRIISQTNHQKMTVADHGPCDHNHKRSGLWDDCDGLVNITTNTIDIDLIDESNDDHDKSNNHSYNRQKRRLPERLEIESKHIPRSGNVLYWSYTTPSSVSTECKQWGNGSSRVANEDEKVTPETSIEITTASLNRLHSLRRQVERADVLIQSMVPSFIEFRAKGWENRGSFAKNHNHFLSSAATSSSKKRALQSETSGRRVDVPAEFAMIIPSRNGEGYANVITRANDNINPLVDYQTQQSFFTLAPCLKSYATTKSAHEFLVLLQNAAVEASAKAAIALTSDELKSILTECGQNCFRNDDNRRTRSMKTDSSTIFPSALEVIVGFLSIIAESRLKPHAPFHLMKRIWVLISAVASHCNDGTLLAQKLASKFDVFLPEGYSMMSSNLLFMQSDGEDCTSLHCQREEIETHNIPGDECARVKSVKVLEGFQNQDT